MDQYQETLSGILPVLPTPFDARNAVDLPALKRLVHFALDAGVSGIVFPGFASEVSELTGDERQNALNAVVEQVSGRVPVIAGATAKTPDDVTTHGRYALSLGLRHIMVQPPITIGNELGPVLEFFRKICTALPDIELILQNAPAPRGADLSPKTISEICARLPQVTYVKEETLPAGPAISHLVQSGPASLKGVIGGGGARFILDEYARGACAAMPALEIADLHVRMDMAWRADRMHEARALYVNTLPLLALQSVYRMNLTKFVLQVRGVLVDIGVRAPTPELDEFARRDIYQNLQELGLFVPASTEMVETG